jgi:hypothetical protein
MHLDVGKTIILRVHLVLYATLILPPVPAFSFFIF